MSDNDQHQSRWWHIFLYISPGALFGVVAGAILFVAVIVACFQPKPPPLTAEQIGEKVGEVGSKFAKGVIKGVKKELKGN